MPVTSSSARRGSKRAQPSSTSFKISKIRSDEHDSDDDNDDVKPSASSPKKRTKGSAEINKKVFTIASDADAVLAACRKLRKSMMKSNAAVKRTIGKTDIKSTSKGSIKIGNDVINLSSGSSSSEEDAYDDDTINTASSTTLTRRVEDLVDSSTGKANPKFEGVVEVINMDTSKVMDGIERIAVNIASQILAVRSKGFQFEVPSRSAGNQIYVPELERIVLGKKKGTRTFLNVKECRKTTITTRVMQLLHQVLSKEIHITKRDLFYTDVKLFVDQSESDGVLDDVATMIGCTRSNLHVVASDKV